MEIIKRIKSAKINMLIKYPFYGSFSADTPIHEDKGVPTFATDGMDIMYNPAFADKLHKDELVFVYSHEILHIAMGHMGREKGRDHPVWAIATDLAINPILKKDGVGKMPDGALYEEKYAEWSAERIYADLYQMLKDMGYMGNGTFMNSQSDDDGDNQSNASGMGSQQPSDQGDEQQDQQGDGSGSDKPDDDKQKQGNGNEPDPQKYKELVERAAQILGVDPQAIKDAIAHHDSTGKPIDQQQIIERTIRAAQAEKTMGKTSAAANILIDSIEEPKIPWQTILSQFVVNQKERTSYRRINRKYQAQDIILPTKHSELLKAVICLDVSGSISNEELKHFFGEVTSILNFNVDNKEIRLIQIDTQILYDEIWTPEMSDDEIYTRHGYGGTVFHEVFKKLDEEQNADIVIFFTDGYASIPAVEPDGYRTIWITTGGELPWGTNIKYQEN